MLNNQNTDSKICREDISVESLMNCPLCNTQQLKENFHRLTYQINNIIIKQKYLFHLPCKNCAPSRYLYWSKKKNGPYIDFIKYRNDRLEDAKQIYEKEHNVILLNKKESMAFLNEKHKSTFNMYLKREFIQEVKLKIAINFFHAKKPQEDKYFCYYIRSELEMIKFHKENGHYYLRTTKTINNPRAVNLINTPPYIFKNSKGKYIFFVNMKERKKPCGICSEIKSFDEFYPIKSMRCGRGTVCKKCNNYKSADYYTNLSSQQRQHLLKLAKIYRQSHYYKQTENKIVRNLRNRLRSVVKDIIKYGIKDNANYSLLKDIQCDRRDLKKHIESQFIEGMTWDNYGPGYELDNRGRPVYDCEGNTIPKRQWLIDHILPISKFNLEDINAIKNINYYKNLRPSWSNENLRKSNKIIGELINNPEIKTIYDNYIKLCHK